MNYASTTQLIKQVVRYKFIPYLISLSFKDNKHMTGSHTFDGTVFAAWCQMEYRYSTPVDQVNTVYCSYEENTVTVTAAGSGFVNGHVLVVNILALIQY